MWQDSNIGNYIEFKIQVTYREGQENPANRSIPSPHSSDSQKHATNSWVLYKRYSNFVDLYEALKPFFKAEAH